MKNQVTNELLRAILHVKQEYKELAIVVFSRDAKWCYMDEDFNAFKFSDNIDVSILQDAIDSVEHQFGLPFIYQSNK